MDFEHRFLPYEITIHETIECLSDVIYLLLTLQNCNIKFQYILAHEHLSNLKFFLEFQEKLSDCDNLMCVYIHSCQYEKKIHLNYLRCKRKLLEILFKIRNRAFRTNTTVCRALGQIISKIDKLKTRNTSAPINEQLN